MNWLLAQSVTTEKVEQSIEQSKNIFDRLFDTFLNLHSLSILLGSLVVAVLLGRLSSMILHRFAQLAAKKADQTNNLNRVNNLRRLETAIVLLSAIIKVVFLSIALYFWYNFAYPFESPTAAVGAGVIFLVLVGGALGPVLRDIAAGSLMMAEQWYGIGDYIRVEPFIDLEGVVDRITLRSTRIQSLNGEVIWLSNQTIQGVRVTTRGARTMAIEMFVSNIDEGIKLLETANMRLPTSNVMIISPLTVMTTQQLSRGVWQITAIGEAAPGREFLLSEQSLEVIKSVDEQNTKQVLLSPPISRYADNKAEQEFARTIKNARKQPIKRRVRRRATDKKIK